MNCTEQSAQRYAKLAIDLRSTGEIDHWIISRCAGLLKIAADPRLWQRKRAGFREEEVGIFSVVARSSPLFRSDLRFRLRNGRRVGENL